MTEMIMIFVVTRALIRAQHIQVDAFRWVLILLQALALSLSISTPSFQSLLHRCVRIVPALEAIDYRMTWAEPPTTIHVLVFVATTRRRHRPLSVPAFQAAVVAVLPHQSPSMNVGLNAAMI